MKYIKKPYKPGYYWVHWADWEDDGKSDFFIVEVDTEGGHSTELEAYRAGYDVNYSLDSFTDWTGPIESPAQPPNITVKYWVFRTWPYSIDEKPAQDAEFGSIDVPLSETYVKNGRLYYNLQSGHSVSTELLITQ